MKLPEVPQRGSEGRRLARLISDGRKTCSVSIGVNGCGGAYWRAPGVRTTLNLPSENPSAPTLPFFPEQPDWAKRGLGGRSPTL
jgi:hypothetical protein